MAGIAGPQHRLTQHGHFLGRLERGRATTIDRMVFLRMAEDRGLESYEQLLKLCERPDIYARFMRDVCRRADEKYNSGLFHFDKEPGVSEAPDRITPKLSVDDKVFKPIIQSLYFSHGSPYDFRVLPVEILGTVYERFLGKVIRLTAGHQAKVEEKPEVRKAGGVYYTPSYIVDYIVKQTVGRKSKGKSPAQLAGGKGKPPFRVLDMACGSGSFLLGAYQCLLDHCLAWYIEHDPKATRSAVYQEPRTRRLAADHRGKETHPDHTSFWRGHRSASGGSDQAVLAAESLGGRERHHAFPATEAVSRPRPAQSGRQYQVWKLPGRPGLLRWQAATWPDEFRRINPFDWNAAFPEAMKAGGFDCVLGNPPYIRIQTMKEWAPWEVEIYKDLFGAAQSGSYDIYAVFIEQGLKLLNPQGVLGFICPHKFFNAAYGAPLRDLLSKGRHLARMVHFGAQQVFSGATTYTCLLFLDKAGRRKCRFVSVPDLKAWMKSGAGVRGDLVAEKINGEVWNFTVGEDAELVQRLKGMPVKLGEVADIFVGLQTSADDIFIMDLVSPTARTLRLRSKSLDAEVTLERDLLFPLVSGADVRGYAPLPERQYILFPYEVSDAAVRLLPLDEIEDRFPRTAEYLRRNQRRLEDREKGRMKRGNWHGYVYLKNMRRQGHVKVCVPRLVDRLCAGWDGQGIHFLDNVDVGGVTLKPAYAGYDLRYLLALLNSRLLAWFFPHVSAPFRGNWMSANRQFLSQLPIRVIDTSDRTDRSRNDRLLTLVEQMLILHGQAADSKTDQPPTALSRQIAATRAQIDQLVYELYGLSEDEIRIVEQH